MVAVSALERVCIGWCCVGAALVGLCGACAELCLMLCVVLRRLFYVCTCGLPWLVLLWRACIGLGDTGL